MLRAGEGNKALLGPYLVYGGGFLGGKQVQILQLLLRLSRNVLFGKQSQRALRFLRERKHLTLKGHFVLI